MIAARRFDVRQGRPLTRVYGCVTTGKVLQFLRLDDEGIIYDTHRFFLDDLGRILASFMHVVSKNAAVIAA